MTLKQLIKRVNQTNEIMKLANMETIQLILVSEYVDFKIVNEKQLMKDLTTEFYEIYVKDILNQEVVDNKIYYVVDDGIGYHTMDFRIRFNKVSA